MNAALYDLKQALRRWFPGRFQLHASQTDAEARADRARLFGAGYYARVPSHCAAVRAQREDGGGAAADAPGHVRVVGGDCRRAYWVGALGGHQDSDSAEGFDAAAAAGYQAARYRRGVWRPALARVSEEVSAHAVTAAVLRTEWTKAAIDVPEVAALIARLCARPNLRDAGENVIRAGWLGRLRLPLVAHLPADVRWHRLVLGGGGSNGGGAGESGGESGGGLGVAAGGGDLAAVLGGRLRLLDENGWPFRCATVADAWARWVAPARARGWAPAPDDPVFAGHEAKVRAMVDGPGVVGALDRTLVAVGDAWGAPGGWTLWDGNHRALAFYGDALGRGAASGRPLLLLVGISPGFGHTGRGSFFCGKPAEFVVTPPQGVVDSRSHSTAMRSSENL